MSTAAHSTKPFIVGVGFEDISDIAATVAAARALDASGVDFLSFGDSWEAQDASLVASFISAQTRQIGLVPTLTTTHTEPFHIATATATLDFTGRARAGWRPVPSLEAPIAEAFGRRQAPQTEAAWAETSQVIDTVRALWDSWEADAEIRDARTGRFIDRSKLHYVDAQLTDSVGQNYSVKGPSIVPRPPQGHPPVFIYAADSHALDVGLASAEVILLPVASVDAATQISLPETSAKIYPSIEVPAAASATWFRETARTLIDAGLAGVHFRVGAGVPAVRTNVATLVADIVDSAGSFGTHRQGTSLRNRLGLSAVTNQFVWS